MFVKYDGTLVDDGAMARNGRLTGDIGEAIVGARWQQGLLQPFIEDHPNSPNRGRPCVTIETGRMIYNHDKNEYLPERKTYPIRKLQERGINSMAFNSVSMRKGDWIKLQGDVVRVYRERLRAWTDLMRRNPFGGFDAMSKLTLEYEAMSDPGEAVVDMDALSDGRTDSPLFKLRSLPLPITHSDFWFSERRMRVSENSNTPLRSVMGEAAGRRCAETVENTLIGNVTGVTFGTQTTGYGTHDGTSTVYGYTNHPARITKTNFTAPNTGGWVPNTFYNEVLSALNTMATNKFYGPYSIYFSTDWSPYMSQVFSVSGGNNNNETLMTMLAKIDGVEDVKRLDLLTSTFTIIIVQQNSNTVQAIDGMPISTVQWPSQGGLRQNYKVMCIQVPLIHITTLTTVYYCIIKII